MAIITIGGEAVSVSLGNYKRLKRAWHYIEAATQNPGFVPGMDAIIGTIAVGLDAPIPGEEAVSGGVASIEAFRIDWIDEHLSPAEIPALRPFMNALLIEAGMVEKSGEPAAVTGAAPETPSPGTSTESSPS